MRRHASPRLDLLDGKAILVAEDDPIVQRVLVRLISHLGTEPTVVPDGAALAHALANQRFSLVISDVKLPGRSGIEVVIERRRLADETPVLLLTGDPEGVEEQVAGIPGVALFAKPFVASELRAGILSAIGIPL